MSIRSAISSFRAELLGAKAKNSATDLTGQEFLQYGGRRGVMVPDWSQVVMTDKDLYTGYMYAAITKRARRATQIATESVKTTANDSAATAANDKNEPLVHPYITAIENSSTFADGALWTAISTYLDLEGVYYLMAVRTVGANRVGTVQEFKLLNPYNIQRVKDKNNLQVQGYIETRSGLRRDIPKEMIIEVRVLNPFSEDDSFSMADAAKEPAFTLKQTDDFTRSSLKHNINSSGIISTDLVLEPEQMRNFKARIMGGNKGEPVFTDGAGAVKYSPMQIDLDKSGLKDITQINIEKTLVVTGVSNTILGTEKSGVTRDSSETQSELFVTQEIIPQLQVIIDALNQDYRNSYPDDFKKFGYKLYLDSPLGSDREAELKDITVRNHSYNLYAVLVGQGYKRELAADYAIGKLDLAGLGEPTEKPVPTDLSPDTVTLRENDKVPPGEGLPADPVTDPAANALVKNDATQAQLTSQAASLQNAIVQIEAKVAAAVSKKVTNAYDSQSDIISDQDRQDREQELVTALALFYAVILPLQAQATMSQRAKEFGKIGMFKMTPEVQRIIKQDAEKAASSHMDTILQDLLEAVQVAEISGGDISAVVEAVQQAYPKESAQAIGENLKTAAEKASRDTTKEAERIQAASEALHAKYQETGFDELLASVRETALKGASQAELQKAIRDEYTGTIAPQRAKVIARTETNRAFTTAQYEADKQFLSQNGLQGKAYKSWETRSGNPCPLCLSLEARGPIPFDTNFANVGDVVSATITKEDGTTTVRKMPVTYEDIEAGNLHSNCSCIYKLIVI